ncbi:hypothetical protein [Flavobacterium aestivum]|uniref:hypothetical protein n=1 Tax=Flavobacterium aestivum TaxID=3003257 RepID=UPI00228612EB|nr:hypothetical protein [Flavobacterium aestivum]
MNAETVLSVAQALAPEELERFYVLILKELGKAEEKKKERIVQKNTKIPLITDAESMQKVWRSLKRAKATKFKHLRAAC